MVTLIGMGSGSWENLSAQAQDAVRRAGLVFGAKRLLAGLPPECTARQFALYQPAEILETLAQAPGQDAAVLYSGDTGFYSGASGLLTPLRALGIPARGRVLHRSACFWWKTSMSRTSARRASRTKASSGARCP